MNDKAITEAENHNEVVFIKSDFTHKLTLDYAPSIMAGFPSPAESYEMEPLDFNTDMIRHPDFTFYARVRGDSMIEAGINDGDIIVVDRSLEPHKGDVIVAFYNHEYTLKYYDDSHKEEGYLLLVPANKNYPSFKITPNDEFTVWGVVQYTIKNWHR